MGLPCAGKFASSRHLLSFGLWAQQLPGTCAPARLTARPATCARSETWPVSPHTPHLLAVPVADEHVASHARMLPSRREGHGDRPSIVDAMMDAAPSNAGEWYVGMRASDQER